ncbi:hypothetical protein Avbf_05619 [Armadillidium vulgare]|nr:hypothetical protein Avbf_05619 [Armadillidium vulgare]
MESLVVECEPEIVFPLDVDVDVEIKEEPFECSDLQEEEFGGEHSETDQTSDVELKESEERSDVGDADEEDLVEKIFAMSDSEQEVKSDLHDPPYDHLEEGEEGPSTSPVLRKEANNILIPRDDFIKCNVVEHMLYFI